MEDIKPKTPPSVEAKSHKRVAICVYKDHIEPETEFLLDRLVQKKWTVLRREGSANIDTSRSMFAGEALSLGAEWILWIDSDMVILPEQVEELERIAYGSGGKVTVLSALASRRGGDTPANSIFDPSPRYVGDVVNVTTGCGAACLLTHRSVYDDLIAAFRMHEVLSMNHVFYPWFEKIKFWFHAGEYICLEEEIDGPERPPHAKLFWASEDQSFAIRAKLCGHPVWVHTGVQIGHKVKEVQWPDWRKADLKYNPRKGELLKIPYGPKPSPPKPPAEVVPPTRKQNHKKAKKK